MNKPGGSGEVPKRERPDEFRGCLHGGLCRALRARIRRGVLVSETLKTSTGSPVFRNESSGSHAVHESLNQANYVAARLPIRFSSVTRFCEVKAQKSHRMQVRER